MAITSKDAEMARVAFQRFGLGAKPGNFKKVAKDPLRALVKEVNTPGIAKISGKGLPSYYKAAQVSQKGDFSTVDKLRRRELDARIQKHMDVDIGFVERLVIFWSNHFSMSVNKSDACRGMLGQLERDVIRKHVLGNFSDMLLGVMTHPAMISFLDNDDSVGPNSKYGQDHGAGFNENLGREVMELHTMGSGSGYTEKDVTAMALLLTGWSYVRNWEAEYKYNGGNPKNRGKFLFRKGWHERGPITLMGKTYRRNGQGRGKQALKWLARRDATAEHIAFKLVRHFITDEPTAAMVEPLAKEFRETKGDLKKVALKLLRLPAAFDAPLTKIRTPYELQIAQFRALNRSYPEDNYWWVFAGPLYAMNNMAWECPTPEGYPDETFYWLDPDGMTLRLDTAQVSGWVNDDRYKKSVVALADKMYGKSLTSDTRSRIQHAGGQWQALTVLFTSPEFQRR